MKEQREKHQRAKQEKQERLQRRNRYAELVSEMFPPTVDEGKKRELEQRVDRLEHPVKKFHEKANAPHSSHPPAQHRQRRRGSDAGVDAGRRDPALPERIR